MAQVAVRQYDEDEHLQDVDAKQLAVEAVAEAKQHENDESTVENSATDHKEETYYHYTVDTKDPDPWLKTHRYKIMTLIMAIGLAVAGNWLYTEHQTNVLTASYVAEPKIDDLYYLDFRLIQDNLRPTEKYRMAKVSDITGNVVTLNYSSYFYPQKHELNETIRYAQLRFEKFFQEKRNNFTIAELQAMIESGAVFLVRRPDGNMLDGNLVVPDKQFEASSVFIPGTKENLAGLEHMKFEHTKTLAFDEFKKSADFGYAPGQVNLAQMYLTGTGVKQDSIEALSWLKKGALQAHEPAILKYGIVCGQVESCAIDDFYQELIKAGVNIEFSKGAIN